jgi:hypothetical protein
MAEGGYNLTPAYSKEKEKEFRAMIRILLTRRPDSSLNELQDAMALNKYALTIDYLNKLYKKVLEERAYRLDHQVLKKEIAKYEDLVKAGEEELWAILATATADEKETKVRAVRTLVEIRGELIDRKIASGIFNVAEENSEGFLNFQVWGQLKPQTIAKLKARATNAQNGNTPNL